MKNNKGKITLAILLALWLLGLLIATKMPPNTNGGTITYSGGKSARFGTLGSEIPQWINLIEDETVEDVAMWL